MDSLRLFAVVVGLFSLVTSTSAGACYQFNGEGRVVFPQEITISTSAHFKLSFRTVADSGILFYAEGSYHRTDTYDFEGLFMRDGYLHYFLFNPPRNSHGTSFGFHGKSKKRVNDGQWHQVEFYRNIDTERRKANGTTERVHRTGLKVDGVLEAFDDRYRSDVQIFPPITLGEDPHLQERSSKSIGNFKGKIQDFEEVENDIQFGMEEANVAGGASHCIVVPDAV
ncbi:uncharacterized protein LOC132750463 [Ruditapes philippinarum]|uniref:uncharacterized protein LOC132750463 n=1 Tax=Ruditapes philippinarum TaxID=129788 RepID=UPI00295BC64D|nr:uncharacterized protein LOC132750463 [Ruditapes philippinarum]